MGQLSYKNLTRGHMTNSRNRIRNDARSWSRRDVLTTGARVAAALAVPQLWLPKSWGATTTFDYYISTTGSDTNPGTLAAPWAFTSFNYGSANNAKMAGKRVGLIAGTYDPTVLTAQSTGYTWCMMNVPAGTSSASTYIASCDTSGVYTPRVAIIEPSHVPSNPILGGNGTQSTANIASYITIDGLTINGNGYTTTGASGGCHLIQFYGNYGSGSSSDANQTGIVIQNCELFGISIVPGGSSGGNYAAIFLEGCYNCIIQNNYIHDITTTVGDEEGHVHGGEEYGCHNNQWIYNTFANCLSGIEAKDACTGTVVAYNYFYNITNPTSAQQAGSAPLSGFDGYSQYAGSPYIVTGPSPINYLIHHNVFDSCFTITETDLAAYYRLCPMNVYNNTVYDTAGTCGWNLRQQPSGNLIFYNNLYWGSGNGVSGGVSGKLGVEAKNNLEIDYNCWYQSSGNYASWWGIGPNTSNVTYSTFAAWKSAIQASLSGAEAHSITSNPMFRTTIVPGNGPTQFQLASGSPCIGTGQGGVNIGAWDGTVTQIGCSFAPGSASAGNPVPAAPALTVS
jgi:hypothetical protein